MRVEFFLSSIDLVLRDASGTQEHTFLSAKDTYKEIKNILKIVAHRAELLLDLQDRSADSENFTLLYADVRKLADVDIELKRQLREFGWWVANVPERPGVKNLFHVIEATKYQKQLRIDLINDFGKTFVHINQSGSVKLERNEHKN